MDTQTLGFVDQLGGRSDDKHTSGPTPARLEAQHLHLSWHLHVTTSHIRLIGLRRVSKAVSLGGKIVS